jgi:hypothetical protein
VLKPAATIKIGVPQLLEMAGDKEISLDFFLSNEGNSDIEIRSFRVVGSAIANTTCYDNTPAITAKIDIPPNGLAVATITDNQTHHEDRVKASGRVELLPCKECRIDLTVPQLFTLAHGEKRKMRVMLPRLPTSGGRTCRALPDWAILTLQVATSGAGTAEARVR